MRLSFRIAQQRYDILSAVNEFSLDYFTKISTRPPKASRKHPEGMEPRKTRKNERHRNDTLLNSVFYFNHERREAHEKIFNHRIQMNEDEKISFTL